MNWKCKSIILTAALFAGGAFAEGEPIPQGKVEALWKRNCATCHGEDGTGQTKAGKKAKVKDLTDKKYQASFTNEEAFKSVRHGKKEGNRTVKKPVSSRVSDEEVKALIEWARKFVAQEKE